MSKLDDLLETFRGKSAEEIAAMISKRGIRGRMGTTYKCPMALLLGQSRTGDFVIGRKYVVRRSGGRIEKARTPANVTAFVRRFDLGGFPALIAPPPRCTHKPGDPVKKRRPSPSGKKHPPIKNHLAKLVGRFSE